MDGRIVFIYQRLFVYHSSAKINSSEYKTFVIMEKKLFYFFIMNPSMIFTWIFGICLIYMNDYSNLLWLNFKDYIGRAYVISYVL